MGLPISEIGSGAKSWSAEGLGEQLSGTVRLVERRQQRSFDGGAPLTWDDGTPRMLTYIELETAQRDSDDDDGVRALYAKGGNFEPKDGTGTSLERAIVDAVRAAGANSIEEGATIHVRLTGFGKATTRGYQPPKLFTAKYEPPKSSVAVDDLFDS